VIRPLEVALEVAPEVAPEERSRRACAVSKAPALGGEAA
jgi:hypothetical protein